MKIGSLPEKVQNNDHKDDQRTWEESRCIEWEVRRFFFLTNRKYKEQSEMKNTIAEMKNRLERINIRLNDREE